MKRRKTVLCLGDFVRGTCPPYAVRFQMKSHCAGSVTLEIPISLWYSDGGSGRPRPEWIPWRITDERGVTMPFIHVRAYSGRDDETKRRAAQALVKAASEAMNAPESAFTVVYEDVEKDAWERDVAIPVIEPLRDKMLIDHGKPV